MFLLARASGPPQPAAESVLSRSQPIFSPGIYMCSSAWYRGLNQHSRITLTVVALSLLTSCFHDDKYQALYFSEKKSMGHAIRILNSAPTDFKMH